MDIETTPVANAIDSATHVVESAAQSAIDNAIDAAESAQAAREAASDIQDTANVQAMLGEMVISIAGLNAKLDMLAARFDAVTMETVDEVDTEEITDAIADAVEEAIETKDTAEEVSSEPSTIEVEQQPQPEKKRRMLGKYRR